VAKITAVFEKNANMETLLVYFGRPLL